MTLTATPFSCASHGKSQAEPGTASTRRSASAAAFWPGSSGTDFSLSGSSPSARSAVTSSMSNRSLAGSRPIFDVGQRPGRGEIVLGAVIDAGAAALEDRRQQDQRLALGGADEHLAAAGGELRPALGHLAHRIERCRARG